VVDLGGYLDLKKCISIIMDISTNVDRGLFVNKKEHKTFKKPLSLIIDYVYN